MRVNKNGGNEGMTCIMNLVNKLEQDGQKCLTNKKTESNEMTPCRCKPGGLQWVHTSDMCSRSRISGDCEAAPKEEGHPGEQGG